MSNRKRGPIGSQQVNGNGSSGHPHPVTAKLEREIMHLKKQIQATSFNKKVNKQVSYAMAASQQTLYTPLQPPAHLSRASAPPVTELAAMFAVFAKQQQQQMAQFQASLGLGQPC
jgi:hypothetical protein